MPLNQPEALGDMIALAVRAALAPLQERIAAVETRAAQLVTLAADVGTLRERVAVAEVRPPVPGPPGKDGRDGLGFEDLSITSDGERTLEFRLSRGDERKLFPVVLPIPRYHGPYQAGRAYVVGDMVTHGGGVWHCQTATTTKPGDGAPEWKLAVRHGRDGRDAAGGR